MGIDLHQKKLEILNKMLELIPQDGWSKSSMEKASIALGHDKHYASLIFIGGINEAIDIYFEQIDIQMMEKMKSLDITKMRIPDRIYEAILARIEALLPYKEIVTKTFSFLSLPWNAPLALKLSWRTMDLIWYELCNDDSTDFNYYTKRTLLLSVYSATLLYWISDNSKDYKNTKRFLLERLENVSELGKCIKKAKEFI